MRSTRHADRVAASARMAVSLLLAVGLMTFTGPVTHAAPAPCRVRNVTQDTFGDSLIRMVEAAVDGDFLWVRGTCRGEVVIRSDIVIAGKGEAPTLTGRDRTRVVHVRRRATVTLRDLAIIRGHAVYDPDAGSSGRGGGVRNKGRLRLDDTTVSGNGAYFGGGIYNTGRLTLTGSTVTDNTVFVQGGGIVNSGRLTLTGSTVSENTGGEGGGIYNGGTLTLTDSTVAGNRAGVGGGGFRGGGLYIAYGSVTVIRSTFSGNTAGSRAGSSGGGIMVYAGTLSLTGSTVKGNTAQVGGGIHNLGRVTLMDVIVRDNEATQGPGGGIYNVVALDLTDSTVTGNTASAKGGGIANFEGGPGPRGPMPPGTVTLDGASSVTDNVPDDCVGTPAC